MYVSVCMILYDVVLNAQFFSMENDDKTMGSSESALSAPFLDTPKGFVIRLRSIMFVSLPPIYATIGLYKG